MTELPHFNFKSIYFFLLSFYGMIFILSLTDVLTIKNVTWIRNASFINICISLSAWILDLCALHLLKNIYIPYDNDYKKYREFRLAIFFFAILFTSMITLIALFIQ